MCEQPLGTAVQLDRKRRSQGYSGRDPSLAVRERSLVLIIGVLREAKAGESRVAAIPATVAQLRQLRYGVVVERAAGHAASFSDEAYAEAGARLGDPLDADIVFGVNPPSTAQLDGLRKGPRWSA